MAMNVNLSANAKPYDQYGQVRVSRFRYTGPASYATGGDLAKAGTGANTDTFVFGLGAVVNFPTAIALDANGANPRLLVYNPATYKVRWFVPNTGAEVAAAVDLSGFTADLEITGF